MTRKPTHEHEESLTVGDREYPCLFRPDGDGGYLVTCEELPPMIAFGETLEEARANAAAEIVACQEVCDERRARFRSTLLY